MAESVPYSDQLVTLFKIREGYANTNSAYEVEQETLVSRPTQLADRIFLNNVPDNAPTDLIRDGSWTGGGERWYSNARPWIVNYRDLVLTSFVGNPNETFFFSSSVLPNVLTNMLLPLMTSTSSPAYTVTAAAGSAPIPASNYMLDRQAGIITIYPGNGVSATQPPKISFWRYEGTTLRDAAMSTDVNGNVTLGGTLTVTGNVGVGGTLSTGNFSTGTFTTSGLYTATGGISVTNGNLSVTNGTTSLRNLNTTGFVTAGNGLSVPAGTLTVANAATVGSLSTTGDISGNTASIAGLLRAGSLSTTGSVTAGSGASVTGGSLTVTNNTTTGTLTVTSGPNTLGAVTTGALTANGPIIATAGLSVSGGISLPGANLSLNDLSANAVDVSGTLRVGTGMAGNNLVISTTSGTTSAIRQNKTTSGILQLGSSAAAPSVLTVADTAGAGTVTVNGALDVSGNATIRSKLTANAVDVSGTLQVGTGMAGNNLVISTTDASTSYIRQTDVSSGTIIFGASVSNPAGLFVRDAGPAGSGFVAITNGTAGSAALNLTGGATACTIVPNEASGNSVRIGSGFLNPSAIVVSDSNTTVNGTLIAPTIIGTGVTVSIGDISGVTIGPSTSFGGAFNGSVISANASTQPRIGLRSTYPDGSSNIIYWDGQALLPGREKPRAGGYGLGIPNYGWEKTYTNNIYPVISPGTVTVNGTLVALTIGNGATTTVNGVLKVGNMEIYDSGNAIGGSGAVNIYAQQYGNVNIQAGYPNVNDTTISGTLYLPNPPSVYNGVGAATSTNNTLVAFTNQPTKTGVYAIIYYGAGGITWSTIARREASGFLPYMVSPGFTYAGGQVFFNVTSNINFKFTDAASSYTANCYWYALSALT